MTVTVLDKTYSPKSIEQKHYQHWEANNWFAPSGIGESYCIMIPPPNVTGSLHMGHAFQDTIMDLLIRYNRMCGKNTLWQPGTDHAGIATQMVVERQLNAENKTRHDLGRDQFIERVWQWKAESGGTITNQLRRMGASPDWTRERFTMDEGLSDAVKEVFVQLHDKGLIYRGKRLVNWDPVLHTAVSDLEVLSQEENGKLWHLRYPLSDDSGYLVVATTRPETMLGDTAVAVHPQDERYNHLIGQSINLPLVNRKIPIIADEYVDPEFGSGCVKITPAHDFNDYEVGLRHALPKLNVFDDNAAINLPDTPYHGLDRYDARKKVVQDLESLDLLDAVQDHKLMVPRGDRTGAVIEPYLTDQWFVKIEPLAIQAIKAVEQEQIRFVPDNWRNTYFEWMNNIQDWCISRQIWWGHRIPAWYDEEGNIYVARSEQEALAQAKDKLGYEPSLHQDNDVLDTWFSSALWPFSTLGWPEQTDELKTFYPTNVLVTGFDIIFFWVARMIMFGIEFADDIPFHEVYIHGLVRDADGQKMSKSKGNVLDPLDLIDGISLDDLVAKRTQGMMQPHLAEKIEKATRRQYPDGIPAFGTDALRFTFTSLATQGRDIRFDLGRIEGNRNFCNKLWNATRYVLMNVESQRMGLEHDNLDFSVCDQWIIGRTQEVTQKCHDHVQSYRFDLLAQTVYQFVWDDYCSWYLELSKAVLNSDDTAESIKAGTRHTLINVLDTILKLLHPIMPFITEEIWQGIKPHLRECGQTIMLESYPTADTDKIDQRASDEIAWVQAVITAVRTIRAEMDIEPRKLLPVLLQNHSNVDEQRLKAHGYLVESVGRIQSIELLNEDQQAPESATGLVGNMKILLPLGALIDKNEELARLAREISKLRKELDKVQAKLNNNNFIERAPETVVKKEHSRAEELKAAIAQLEQQKSKVESIA